MSKGLYKKYLVLKHSSDGIGWMMKQTDSFVLSPEKGNVYGRASRAALVTYAHEISEVNPGLAQALIDWEKECKP